ncbi:MAG TPA: tol-pal system protein YbgF [Gammaproteobacteria bacterium]|nr:tol-pal system protein YbgF [Gammaproteobacteria bacterium]
MSKDDPVAIRLSQVENKLARIERLTQNDSLLRLASQIEQLQQEVRELRGEVERLSHAVSGIQSRQRDLYLDIDRRLQALEAGGATGDTAVSGERDAYQAAFDLLRESRYAEAEQAFSDFLTTYPESSFADNAQYWLGETNYVTRDFKAAVDAFRKVIDNYPDSTKSADAWLKMGYSYYEMDNMPEARDALQTVVNNYPGHAAARLAQQRLEEMGN